jgi:hypothetical protein
MLHTKKDLIQLQIFNQRNTEFSAQADTPGLNDLFTTCAGYVMPMIVSEKA